MGHRWDGVRLYVGGDAYTVQRRRCFLLKDRMFSGAYGPISKFLPEHVPHVNGLLDSGAFSDPPEKRLTPEKALERQYTWEAKASRIWQHHWQAEGWVSYDLLIDEKWTNRTRKKERWSVAEADRAVKVTVNAAAFMAGKRTELAPRKLVLACQGVDGVQYEECLCGVLEHARPGDIIGLGGWCILGLMKRWLPTFWDAMRRCLPRICAAGIDRVHIFGVMWPVALGGLLWLADQYGIAVSTDSSAPILQTTWKDQSKSGTLEPTWEANVEAWKRRCAGLRGSDFYREPQVITVSRQQTFWD